MTTEQTIERAKREIRADIAAGRVPAGVASFAELHDHVDANEYGGGCEDSGDLDRIEELREERKGIKDTRNWPGLKELQDLEYTVEEKCRFWNAVQSALDQWIKAGMPE